MTAVIDRPTTTSRTADEARAFFADFEVLAAEARWDAYRRDLAIADLLDGWMSAPAPVRAQAVPAAAAPVFPARQRTRRTLSGARYGIAGIAAAFGAITATGTLLVTALNSAIA